MEKIRIGVVGLGHRGRHMARLAADNFDCTQFVAACDIDPLLWSETQWLQERPMKEMYPDIHFYTDDREMLDLEKLDLVMVETGADVHAGFCIEALNRGIDVFSDIPSVATLAEADRLWHTVTDRAKLMELPDALRLRVLKRYLPYADYERSDLLTLDALLSAQTGTRRDLKRGYVAWVSDRRLYIGSLDAPAYCVPLAIGGTAIVPGGTVTARRVQHASFPCKPNTAYVRESAVSGALTVRSPQTGDRFTPFGMAGSKLLSDYFTDRKVPRGFRSVPIVADEAGILWVAGYTVDERARVAAHNTAILELQYEEVPAHVGK